ncbi:adenylosuccinate lyase [bacterium]|nr:adenylosuccinate lyase [bacterium]
MIERYTRAEMGAIWQEEHKLSCWLQVEKAVCSAWTKRGIIPPDALQEILNKSDFDLKRVQEIEAETHHDVIAFLTSVSEFVGPSSRFIHLGMTSSDMLDTGLALQIKESGPLILKLCDNLLDALKEKALEYKNLPAVGRTHGIHAEPVSFGLRFARFYEQMERARKRFKQAWDAASVGKISGAVGCYVHLEPVMEEEVMDSLGLGVAPISSQVVSRDRHADLLAAIALIGAILESIALEVRHLQRTEVGEAREGFAKGQKGSSAMPHKRNPINAEKICGMARVLRANMHAGYENVALWHERDISHSSVERIILPDSFIALDYLLHLTVKLVTNLVVDEAQVKKVLELTGGAIFSEGLLLHQIRQGNTREDAYKVVQKLAHSALDSGVSFQDTVIDQYEYRDDVERKDIQRIFDLDHALRNVDAIFQRLGLLPDEPSTAREGE